MVLLIFKLGNLVKIYFVIWDANRKPGSVLIIEKEEALKNPDLSCKFVNALNR